MLDKICNDVLCFFIGHDPRSEVEFLPKMNAVRVKSTCRRCGKELGGGSQW
jgi:hypothetical protein